MTGVIGFQTACTIVTSSTSKGSVHSLRRFTPSATAVYPTRTGTRPFVKAPTKPEIRRRNSLTTVQPKKSPALDPRAEEAAKVLAEYNAFLTSPAAAGIDPERPVYLIHNNSLVCQYP